MAAIFAAKGINGLEFGCPTIFSKYPLDHGGICPYIQIIPKGQHAPPTKETDMTTDQKIARAIEILEAKGQWTEKRHDAVEYRARTCDGKDTPTQIARYVVKHVAK